MNSQSESISTGDVRDDWGRIERWLDANAPAIRTTLRDGASHEQVSGAGNTMDAALPSDVRESYGIHDGQYGGPPLFGEWSLLSLDDMMKAWRVMKNLLDDGTFVADGGNPTGPIRENWWHGKWIPFAGDGSGDFYCLDLAPSAGGDEGQIISFWHADARRELLAPSFAAWLHRFADDLENGLYAVVDGWLERAE
jgi:cell wall assembly regulator SMI1